jgi:photosystem II stability/assembly factor-like uncharacterized protein
MYMLTREKKSMISLFLFMTVAFFIFEASKMPAYAQEPDSGMYKQLKYRFIGPQGNRIIAVAGVPGDPNIFYAGAASGGIFKSIDGGVNWKPVFDSHPVSSVGSLAIAPSDSNIIWAGTGETFIRSNVSQGNGIYKSTDAGKTWKHMGLDKTGRIGRIAVDPRNPDVVFAAAMGHCYGPQQERGVFRTMDGGKTWKKVLFVDENTGCSDLAMDPNNPRILFAGMWTMLIRTWGRWSGGPGDGLYVSRDSGETWKRLTGNGLPKNEMGKIAVAVAPSDSNRVYALIETEDEGLWRSDDGGKTWKHVNHDHALLNRPHYYNRMAVAPDDPDEIYFPATRFHRTLNGGETIERYDLIGGDHHDMWIDPLNPSRMIVGNDNPCLSISVNRGKTWNGVRLPTAQMYHVHVDSQVPYYVYGNRQDGPSTRGPSNSRVGSTISSGMWHSVGGNESGFAIPDPVDNNIVWAGKYDGMLDRFDLRTRHARAVTVWPESIQCWAAADMKYRFQWTFPILISPHDHNRVYVGSQYVHMTTNGGHSWNIISPDLSTNDKSKQKREGGITPDDTGPTVCCVLFALAESPLEEGQIWAGTNDGLLHITRDGGENWTNVTDNIPDLPPWGTVSNIEPSRYDAGTCYITADLHQVNNRDPFVYKTEDYGKSWKSISSDIPKSELSYAHCVREDPVRKGLLYLGTENALYISFNDGQNWIPYQNNLPPAPVHWITVQEDFNDLVVATYGRGFWIQDDITPLQQFTQEVSQSDIHLFTPRTAYRFRNITSPMSHTNDQCLGKNPPYGACINYYLKSESEDEIEITILDEEGKIVRKIEEAEDEEDEENQQQKEPKITKKAGINRIFWDLRHDQTEQVKLRTSPAGHSHVTVGPKGWRTLGRRRPKGPLAAPGKYTVKLKVGERELTEELIVKKDPNSGGSDEDVRIQVKRLLEIRDNINTLAGMINRIEWIRKQIYDLNSLLKGMDGTEPVIEEGKKLDEKFIALEDNFFSMRLTGSGDGLRWPDKFYVKLGSLASSIEQSDFIPTIQQVEAHEEFKKRLAEYQSQLDGLLSKDLAAFNDMLRQKNISNIISKE